MATYVAEPYAAVWDPSSTNLTLVQKGSIEINVEYGYTEVTDNDHGDQVIKHIARGAKTCKITVPVTDHAMATLYAMLPMTTQFVAGGTRIEFRPAIGTDMTTKAKKLVLKKIVAGAASTDETEWITATLAAPMGAFKMTLGNEQSVYSVEFHCYPDTNNNNRFLFFGDETAS